jgi:hypothetical protein
MSSAALFAQDPLIITTRLDNAVQSIGRIIFAIPKNNGGWQSTGQVPVSAENEKVTVNGSLLTNGTRENVIQANIPKNVSILGGKGNKMLATAESTLIGGSGNSTTADQSFIAGGESNIITGNATRAVILGGKENTLSGEDSIILGGEKNRITGSGSVALGNNVSITGDRALAAGSGVKLQASGSFVWNGSGTFTVSQDNLFAINAQRGMAIRTNDPHAFAALTVSGDIRIQDDNIKNDQITCDSTTAGTMKTIPLSNTTVCSCLCDGKSWQSVIDTVECKKQCQWISCAAGMYSSVD